MTDVILTHQIFNLVFFFSLPCIFGYLGLIHVWMKTENLRTVCSVAGCARQCISVHFSAVVQWLLHAWPKVVKLFSNKLECL